MAKAIKEQVIYRQVEPTVSELILKFMFDIDKHLSEYSMSLSKNTFEIHGAFKVEDKDGEEI